ncbi:MAG: hypothetical protein JO161_04520 [Planctomycetaceae bacterium]|nr:hypothetical protein [Planctomycetaceae bacterium]
MSHDNSRCAHCPVGPDVPCAGLRVRRLCTLVDPTQPSYNPGYVALLRRAGLNGPGAAVDSKAAQNVRPTSVSLAEIVLLIKEIKACPHRTGEAECGCAGLARCSLGKGYEGLVNHHDCLACLRASAKR